MFITLFLWADCLINSRRPPSPRPRRPSHTGGTRTLYDLSGRTSLLGLLYREPCCKYIKLCDSQLAHPNRAIWAGVDLNHQNPKALLLQSSPLPVTVYLPRTVCCYAKDSMITLLVATTGLLHVITSLSHWHKPGCPSAVRHHVLCACSRPRRSTRFTL